MYMYMGARPRWTHGMIITSLLRQNYVGTSFWRNNDIIMPYVYWDYLKGNIELEAYIHDSKKIKQLSL